MKKDARTSKIEEVITEAAHNLRNKKGHYAFWERGTAPSVVRRLCEWGSHEPETGYNAPHRGYHTWDHVVDVVERVLVLADEAKVPERERRMLILAAAFHDYVYDPAATDNEKRSADELGHAWARAGGSEGADIDEMIRQMQVWILETKTHKPTSPLSKILCEADMAIVAKDQPFSALLEYERGIFKEYQFLDYGLYQANRVRLLRNWAEEFPSNAKNLHLLADYVDSYRPRIGIIPGSFDPFHKGHLNIVEKAEKLFDKVIVAQGVNPLKPKKDEEHDVAKVQALRFRQKEQFSGLLPTYVTEKSEHADVTLVRGLRNGDDLAYEVNQLRFIEDFNRKINTIFIHCDREFEHLSSSMVRAFEQIAPSAAEKYKV